MLLTGINNWVKLLWIILDWEISTLNGLEKNFEFTREWKTCFSVTRNTKNYASNTMPKIINLHRARPPWIQSDRLFQTKVHYLRLKHKDQSWRKSKYQN